jgi:hypothetical protein
VAGASNVAAKELEQLRKDIMRLQQLERAGTAGKEDKVVLAQYLAKEARLQAKLQQGEL